MSNDVFAIATRCKYRYPYNGQISTEDLWDLSPAQLDKVYKTLGKTLTNTGELSLVKTTTPDDEITQAKLDIVKFVYETKIAEKQEAVRAAERRAYADKLQRILESKKDAALESLSVEELEKKLQKLKS